MKKITFDDLTLGKKVIVKFIPGPNNIGKVVGFVGTTSVLGHISKAGESKILVDTSGIPRWLWKKTICELDELEIFDIQQEFDFEV